MSSNDDRIPVAPTREVDVAIGALSLENGLVLPAVTQRVSFYGAQPAADGSNIMYVAHALTGSGRIADWWTGFVGPGQAVDTNRLAIIGMNVLGSCYGSTGPLSLRADGTPYGGDFPVVTVGDMVRAQMRALQKLGIGQMRGIVGGSLGAMQALQWIMFEPARFAQGYLFGAYDSFSSMAIALNSLSRAAILHDPNFKNGYYDADNKPQVGLRLARMIAMVTYKSEALFAKRFGRRPDRAGGDPAREPRAQFDVEGYLEYQGQKFIERMDANAYLTLTRAMDLFNVQQQPTPSSTKTKLTFVGISSDILFPPALIQEAAVRFDARGYDSVYLELASDQGHDAFLADLDALTQLVQSRLSAMYSN